MTMWTSADAINAEIEYRRERVRATSRAIRMSRSARKERARRVAQVEARRADNTAAMRDGRRDAAPVPEQRAPEAGTKTKQPV